MRMHLARVSAFRFNTTEQLAPDAKVEEHVPPTPGKVPPRNVIPLAVKDGEIFEIFVVPTFVKETV